ncbi:MAG: hypothetical protein J2P28_01040 [Actinobacteria bacterium]|nr:hypothetical protein [Actinomycetota bacterium]
MSSPGGTDSVTDMQRQGARVLNEASGRGNTVSKLDDAKPAWRELFPNGRCIFYEGNDPRGFAEQIRAQFGFDPAADPHWGKGLMHGPDGEDLDDPFGRSYGFHCPPQHLDAIYNGFQMGS